MYNILKEHSWTEPTCQQFRDFQPNLYTRVQLEDDFYNSIIIIRFPSQDHTKD